MKVTCLGRCGNCARTGPMAEMRVFDHAPGVVARCPTFVLGPAAGFAVGAVGSWVMDRVDRRFQIRREYQSLYGIGLVLGSFAAGEAVGGDGFLAAFAAGLAVTVVNQTPVWAGHLRHPTGGPFNWCCGWAGPG